MSNQTLYRIGFWVVSLCVIRMIAVVLMAHDETILRIARILTEWAIAPQVALWTFLVLAIGLLIFWERLSPSRARR